MITLTAPNGFKLRVRPDAITLITPDPERFMGGKTIVRIDQENHGVMETVEQIEALINKAS